MPVLPGRPWGGRVVSDAHRRKTLGDRLTVRSVTVADQVIWCFIPREGLGDLLGDPFRRGISCQRR